MPDREDEAVAVRVGEPGVGGLARIALELVEVEGGEDVGRAEPLAQVAVAERLDHLDHPAPDGDGALAERPHGFAILVTDARHRVW